MRIILPISLRTLLTGGILLLSLATTPVFAEGRVGSVTLPQGAVDDGDIVLLVFSDEIIKDPLRWHLEENSPVIQSSPMAGCLSVARIDLKSGQQNLHTKGTLKFSCEALPDKAEVFGWIDNNWQKIESHKSNQGDIFIRFQKLTTYAIFESPPSSTPQI